MRSVQNMLGDASLGELVARGDKALHQLKRLHSELNIHIAVRRGLTYRVSVTRSDTRDVRTQLRVVLARLLGSSHVTRKPNVYVR